MTRSELSNQVVPEAADSGPREWVAESNRYSEDHHCRNPTRGFVTIHDDPRPLKEVAETLSGLLHGVRRQDQLFWQHFRMPPDKTRYCIRNVVTGEIISPEMVEAFARLNLPIDNPTLREWFRQGETPHKLALNRQAHRAKRADDKSGAGQS